MEKKNQIIKRLVQLIGILLGISFLAFLLLYISPGDPAQKKLTARGVAVTEDVLEQTRKDMGIDRPFLVQYGEWLVKALGGNLGESYSDGLPVAEKLGKGLKNTGLLSGIALAMAVLVSVPLGICGAVRQGGPGDRLICILGMLGNSMPNFLVSVLLMYFFCIRIRAFPVMAGQSAKGLFLPALTLAIPLASQFVRQVRAEVLEQLRQPYVKGAMARGVKGRFILFGNVLHNAMISIGTIFGLSLGSLMAGSVVVENIFLWPGVGKLVMDAITARDYPVVQGFVLVMAVIYTLVNLSTDLASQQLDPRIGREQEVRL